MATKKAEWWDPCYLDSLTPRVGCTTWGWLPDSPSRVGKSSSRCSRPIVRAPTTTTRGQRGSPVNRGYQVRRADGVPGKISTGSRYARSLSPRSPTTISKAIAFAMPRRSSVGGLIGWHRRAATTSWTRRFPLSCRRFSMANENPGSGPFTIWSGLDVHSEDAAALLEIERFYASGFATTLAGLDPGLADVQRYELLARDRHGGFGANMVSAFTGSEEGIADGAGWSALAALPTSPASWRNGIALSWSLLYRSVAETGPSSAPPHAIYMVGVNPPSGMSDDERATFVEFYTSVHVREVAKRRHCTRATVYELDRELLRPKEGSPEFLGVYEVEDAASVVTRHVGGYRCFMARRSGRSTKPLGVFGIADCPTDIGVRVVEATRGSASSHRPSQCGRIVLMRRTSTLSWVVAASSVVTVDENNDSRLEVRFTCSAT